MHVSSIPEEVMLDNVFSRLRPADLAKAVLVCRKWKELIDSEEFHKIFFSRISYFSCVQDFIRRSSQPKIEIMVDTSISMSSQRSSALFSSVQQAISQVCLGALIVSDEVVIQRFAIHPSELKETCKNMKAVKESVKKIVCWGGTSFGFLNTLVKNSIQVSGHHLRIIVSDFEVREIEADQLVNDIRLYQGRLQKSNLCMLFLRSLDDPNRKESSDTFFQKVRTVVEDCKLNCIHLMDIEKE